MTVVLGRKGNRVSLGDVKSWPLAGIEMQRTAPVSRALELLPIDGLTNVSTYAAIYGTQPWLYAVVNKLTRGIARMPLKSYTLDSTTGERERLREHPLPILLSRPYPRGSRFRLIEATVGSLAIYGNCLWWKYRQGPGKPPIELWPLDWRYITIHTGDQAPIDHYQYYGPAGSKKFLPDDVVHFQWWSPAGAAGTSPLEPLRLTLMMEDAAQRYGIASFANAARPSGVIVGERQLNERQRKILEAEIRALHEGPDNAFRIALLESGLDWKPMSHTAVEAEVIAQRKLNREEAAAVYDLPPPSVQILDQATYSNISEQAKMLYRDSFGPWFGMIEETLEAQLLWGEPAFLDAFCEFDLSEVMRADDSTRAQAYASYRTSGTYTINELRDRENLPRIDNPAADAVLIPLNMEPVGDGADLGTAPRDPAAAALLDLADALGQGGN